MTIAMISYQWHVPTSSIPSPITVPVLCHGPAQWSPPSGSSGGSPMHVTLQLTSPPAGICMGVVLSLSDLPDVDLAIAAGDTIYHIGLLAKR